MELKITQNETVITFPINADFPFFPAVLPDLKQLACLMV